MADRIAALEGAIREVRGGDSLRPVAVLVPNPLQGLWLSRRVFADTGHIAIDFLLPRDLAWRIALPGLLAEGRARIPENVDLALLLAALPGAVADPTTPAYLVDAAGTSGFGPAALRTIRDLEAAGLDPAVLDAAPAADPDRLRLLARLWRGFRDAVAAATRGTLPPPASRRRARTRRSLGWRTTGARRTRCGRGPHR